MFDILQMRIIKVVTAAPLFALLVGCGDPPVDHEAESQALMELSRQWSAYVASGDLESALAIWADDAVMLPPDLPVLEGRKAIQEYVAAA